MSWLTRVLRVGEIALVFAAAAVMVRFYLIEKQATLLLERGQADMTAIEQQSAAASKTLGYILRDAAVTTNETAKLAVVEQHYWRQQNDEMSALFDRLNTAADTANRTVEDFDGTVREATGTIKDFRASSKGLLADADRNLGTLEETETRLNDSIAALDLPRLGTNLNTVMANAAETSGHVNKISADAQMEADKFVAPRTGWQRFKGFLSVAGRLGAFLAIKVL